MGDQLDAYIDRVTTILADEFDWDEMTCSAFASAEVKAQLTSPGGWGTVGSATEHQRYSKRANDKSRRRCPWCPKGHRKRATHVGMANGLALTSGCEWHVAMWVRGVQPEDPA